MLIWLVFAVLSAAAAAIVLAPLGRAGGSVPVGGHELRVYRDQLAEIDRERAEGRLGDSEAEAARAEVARRLIDADAAEAGSRLRRGPDRRAVLAAVVAALAIPLFSLVIYLAGGAPALPGKPLAAREDRLQQPQQPAALVAAVERHLAANPEDGRGWEVLAPVYLRMNRPDDAIWAWQNAIRILGETAARQASLGEAIVASRGGIVTAEAAQAFRAALTIDPAALMPQFFLALAADQDGDHAAAAAGWRAMLASGPADAPWRPEVEAAVARAERASGGTAPPGPSRADVAAASAMSNEDRTAMIEGMVEGLAARLAEDGDDPEGWLRLMRSYAVLGRPEDAASATRTALTIITDPEARRRIAALAAELGVDIEDRGSAQP